MPTASPGSGKPAEDAEEKTDGASGSPGEETWKRPGMGREVGVARGPGEPRCAAHTARDLRKTRAAAEGVVLYAGSPIGTWG